MVEYRKWYGGRECLITELSGEDPYSEEICSRWNGLSHPAAAKCIRVWYNGGVHLIFPIGSGWITLQEKSACGQEEAYTEILRELADFLEFLRTRTKIPYTALRLSEEEILIDDQNQIHVCCMPLFTENEPPQEAYFTVKERILSQIREKTEKQPKTAGPSALTIKSVDTPVPVSFTVTQDAFILGKSGQRSDGVIPEVNTVSRAHAKITRQQGLWYVTDLQSANGTYVDGVRIPPMEPVNIAAGTVLKLANYTFSVE